ncbi:hypothetical protein TAL182_CH02836 [Rhizobium sp. TAL182]|nr:hypothetical protein TAL182_CH02836 [Rhizobium sp. TAL182]
MRGIIRIFDAAQEPHHSKEPSNDDTDHRAARASPPPPVRLSGRSAAKSALLLRSGTHSYRRSPSTVGTTPCGCLSSPQRREDAGRQMRGPHGASFTALATDADVRFQGCRAARHDDHIHIQIE